ncbi:MAG TPA: hypothetical protein VG147_00055 [Solirubrobacteraceae bacterium]|nr:hypothetical protein [Solirubrobacteraceae bacterium]
MTREPELGEPPVRAPAVTRPSPPVGHPQVFTRLKWTSFTHSCIYTALLICAFAAGKPQPETFVLGLTHGLLWIGMSLACIVCVRLRIVPLRLATAVAVLGGIGPFFGSFEFVRESRRREATVATGTVRAAEHGEGGMGKGDGGHGSAPPPSRGPAKVR